MKNFVIEVTVSGKAEAVGLSLGPHKDLLTALEPNMGTRRLLLAVDMAAGCWAFRIEEQSMIRCWWDAAGSRSVPDLSSCQRRRVKDAVDNVIMAHEQKYMKAFEIYNGTTYQSLGLTVGLSEFDSTIRSILEAEGSARCRSAEVVYSRLDVFHLNVGL